MQGMVGGLSKRKRFDSLPDLTNTREAVKTSRSDSCRR